MWTAQFHHPDQNDEKPAIYASLHDELGRYIADVHALGVEDGDTELRARVKRILDGVNPAQLN